jgi:exodeoxyribonuclease VII small subunit
MPNDTTPSPTTPATTQPGYAAALTELDSILRELESSDVDVDHLAERVARAAELIQLCRTKISAAQLRIEAVTADLDAAVGAPEPD